MTDSVKTNEIAGDVAEFARARIERLRAELQRQGLDAMYVRDLSNIAWLTAFQGVFDGEDAHAAFADATRSVVHTDSRYTAAMRIAAGAGPWDVSGQAAPHAVWLHGLVEDGMKLGI